MLGKLNAAMASAPTISWRSTLAVESFLFVRKPGNPQFMEAFVQSQMENVNDLLVSVILPVYNGESYVEAALDSIAAQSFHDFEVIAIDDGSQDKSLKILEGWRKFPLRIIHLPKNQGLPTVLNIAVKEARGDYFAYLACDDMWMPWKLQSESAFMEKNLSVSVGYSDFLVLFPDESKRMVKCPDFDADLIQRECFINFSSTLIRMEALRKLQVERGFAFNTKLPYCLDWELWQSLSQRHHIFKHIHETTSLYRIHKKQCSWSVKGILETWRYNTQCRGFNFSYSMKMLRVLIRSLASNSKEVETLE